MNPPKTLKGTILKSADASKSLEKLQAGAPATGQQKVAVQEETQHVTTNQTEAASSSEHDTFAKDLIFDIIGRSKANQERVYQHVEDVRAKIHVTQRPPVTKFKEKLQLSNDALKSAESASKTLSQGLADMEGLMDFLNTGQLDGGGSSQETSTGSESIAQEHEVKQEVTTDMSDSDSTVALRDVTRSSARARKTGRSVCVKCNRELWGYEEAQKHFKLCQEKLTTVAQAVLPKEVVSSTSVSSASLERDEDYTPGMDVDKAFNDY